MPGTGDALLALMTPESAVEMRHQVARAIAKGGFDKDIEAKLFEMMEQRGADERRGARADSGRRSDGARAAVAMYADKPKPALDELSDLWYKSFGYWSTEDLEKGLLFKYVENADAISHLELNAKSNRKDIPVGPQEWARRLLMRQFDNLHFDNGPHSFTRVVLRHRLWKMAKGDDQAKREGAVKTLMFMKEQGVLLSLRDEKGPGGELAKKAYFELMNPKVLQVGKIAAEAAKDSDKQPQQ